MTFQELLKLSYKKIKNSQKEEEAVKLLLMELSNQDPHQFFLNLKKEVDASLEKTFLEKLDLYINHHIPVQHLIGHSYFYGYQLIVNEHVLIPRGETEQLVEHVLYYYDQYFDNEKIDVLDLGTGSGCIGLTLALEEENLNVTISDISQDALNVATKNKKNLKAKAKIILSDLFQNIDTKFDIIVSNPPYIPDSEIVDPMVKKEPSVALYGGTLGTDFYKKIIEQSKLFIKEKALIAFEHGFQQSDEILKYATFVYPESSIIQLKDLAGKDRFTLIGIGGVLNQELVE
ncbi:MAG: peptide chain release factor N(5)-glutamine methyltransferase [Acholeplasmataceae bacterium]|nr:peptide chain release factor N(5)-glutamine methyltransferase [Acholeplasmataceae bacterium]